MAQSRVEAILQAIIDGTDISQLQPPQSRNEILLLQILNKIENISAGGSIPVHVCTSSEYDSETRIPTITNPEPETFYLVPNEENEANNLFVEWVYIDDAWEKFFEVKTVAPECGMTDDVRLALLTIAQHVAYTDNHGRVYYNALYEALYPDTYPRIGTVFNPGSNTIYVDEGLNALKQYMTVKLYEDATDTGTVIASSDYTLSGILVDGENTVMVKYNGMATTVQVEAVDFYNQLEWTYPGNLQIDTGTLKNIWGSNQDLGTTHTETPQPSQKWFDNFRHGYVLRGLTSFYQESTKFPVPIPQNATSVTLAITPADNYINCAVERYDNGKYTYMTGGSSGWLNGGGTFGLTPYTPKTQADEQYFLCVYAKHTSATDGGSEITVNGISVTFSTT